METKITCYKVFQLKIFPKEIDIKSSKGKLLVKIDRKLLQLMHTEATPNYHSPHKLAPAKSSFALHKLIYIWLQAPVISINIWYAVERMILKQINHEILCASKVAGSTSSKSCQFCLIVSYNAEITNKSFISKHSL